MALLMMYKCIVLELHLATTQQQKYFIAELEKMWVICMGTRKDAIDTIN